MAGKTAQKKSATAAKPRKTAAKSQPKVTLLSGGNPQIAKGDGDAPKRAEVPHDQAARCFAISSNGIFT